VVLPCFANLWLASFRSVKGGKTKLAASGVNHKAASSTLSSLPLLDELSHDEVTAPSAVS
jgi:hypothetical protein